MTPGINYCKIKINEKKFKRQQAYNKRAQYLGEIDNWIWYFHYTIVLFY